MQHQEILISKLSDDSKVNLINLDTIKEISKANQSEREELCRQSNTMISKAKEETMQWLFPGTNGRKQFAPWRKNVQRSWKIVIHIYQENRFWNKRAETSKKVLNASLQRMIKEPIQN